MRNMKYYNSENQQIILNEKKRLHPGWEGRQETDEEKRAREAEEVAARAEIERTKKLEEKQWAEAVRSNNIKNNKFARPVEPRITMQEVPLAAPRDNLGWESNTHTRTPAHDDKLIALERLTNVPHHYLQTVPDVS